jgi:hypothetical protein
MQCQNSWKKHVESGGHPSFGAFMTKQKISAKLFFTNVVLNLHIMHYRFVCFIFFKLNILGHERSKTFYVCSIQNVHVEFDGLIMRRHTLSPK